MKNNIISNLKLTNFRNYQESKFSFGLKTIICGRNGIGKTNLLEAVNICSTTKSFRGNPDSSLVLWGNDYYRLESQVKGKEKELLLEIIYQKNNLGAKKITRVNKNKVSLADFVGELKTVVYSFESNEIILGSPSVRRKFIDSLLCQIDGEYTRNLLKLLKVVKNRNELLFKIRENLISLDELNFWDSELCKLSIKIDEKREDLIKFINSNINNFYNEISDLSGKLSVVFDRHSILDVKELKEKRREEIKRATTLYGPHRDDILFLIDGNKVVDHLSRGEIKSVLFALKKSEAEFIYKNCSIYPLVLIDDIFAELDVHRRHKLADFIKDSQVIISSTEEKELKELFNQSELIVLNGQVK